MGSLGPHWGPWKGCFGSLPAGEYWKMFAVLHATDVQAYKPERLPLHVLEAACPGARCLQGRFLGGSASCFLQLLPSDWGLMWWKKSPGVSSASCKGANPIMGTLSSRPHLTLITSPKPRFLAPSHCGQGFNIEIWGDTIMTESMIGHL